MAISYNPLGLLGVSYLICTCAFIYNLCSLAINFHKLETLEEQEVKKQWLRSFISFIFLNFTNQLAFITDLVLNIAFLMGIGFFQLLPLFWFWITYHYSYKKKGTIWLKLAIVTSVPIEGIKGLIFIREAPVLIITIITIGLSLLYLVCSIYLHQLNAKTLQEKSNSI